MPPLGCYAEKFREAFRRSAAEDEWEPTTPTSTVVTDDASPVVEHGANVTTRKRRKPLLHRFFGRKAALDVSYGSASYVYHGEDAMAVASYYHIVADGVSAAGDDQHRSSSESPSALLARTLVTSVERSMVQYEAFLQQCPSAGSNASFQERVLAAISHAQSQLTFAPSMASTLVVCFVDRRARLLYTFCIGDSKAIVVRKGRVVYETFAVLKEFNVPAVVNHRSVSRFMVQSIGVQPGDRLVTFSDGIGDNVFKDDLVHLVAPLARRSPASAKTKMLHASHELPSSLCSNVAHAALASAGNDWREYPFSVGAAKEFVSRAATGAAADKKAAATLKLQLKDAPATLERSVAAIPAGGYAHHYTLGQVQRMAALTHKKPDDMSICLSVFA
ncbi:hypothetical protein ACHHYP_15083 [Achlya hypogyna]|uniref:Protein phosphatase n=1 Tax=Achlya hypogyna TaxID=1202772 RepID=A0A1V9YBL8_ACHHY|nr:hypothetical protein ACHHYP_15083 [Achlya hypogyna]